MTDTQGLSRREHLLAKLQTDEPLNDEEVRWAKELFGYPEGMPDYWGTVVPLEQAQEQKP